MLSRNFVEAVRQAARGFDIFEQGEALRFQWGYWSHTVVVTSQTPTQEAANWLANAVFLLFTNDRGL